MKATLSFNLPDEQDNFENAINATSMSILLYELDMHLRALTKYPPDTQSEEVCEAIDQIRQKLHDLAREYSVKL